MIDTKQSSRNSIYKRLASIALSAALLTTTFLPLGSITTMADSGGSDTEVDYGLMDNIQDGTILHCFDWKYTDIIDELPNIAEAGFTSIQTSPAQVGQTSGKWYWLYQPLGFYIGDNDIGTKADLEKLCEEAHKYGIKIIVDVVANHLAGDHTNIDEELKPDEYWREKTENWDTSLYSPRYIITHKDVGMPDIVSENVFVQQKVKNYVQELKSVGVDGIRWDVAKGIQLPSEECAFWSEVLDTEMYNYGEVTGNPGGSDTSDADNLKLMQEYTEYMSVTDDGYGYNLREAFNSDTLPGTIGTWVLKNIPSNKLVYWGESHDNWSNNKEYGGYSINMSQNVIDRAYAIAAARDGSTALYFSRPVDSAGNEIKVKDNIIAGVKGSTHFTSAEVSAVNHFHNAMAGQADYYCKNSGSAAAVCREQGAVIVAASGGNITVTVPNGNGTTGTTTPGTYTDEITGEKWTVTNTTISGTIGSTGIAVIYNDAVFDGSVSASVETGSSFADELEVTLKAINVTNATYTTSDGQSGSYKNNQKITIGSTINEGQYVTLTVSGKKKDGTEVTETYQYRKKVTNEKVIAYFDNTSYNWSSVNAYIYNDDGAASGWPGEAMTYDPITGYYAIDVTRYAGNGKIIFSQNGSGKNRYPADQLPGLDIGTGSMVFLANYQWKAYQGRVWAESEKAYFTDTLNITLNSHGVEDAVYQIGSDSPKYYGSGETITIGEGMSYGDTVTLTLKGYQNGIATTENTYEYTKKDPDTLLKIYFDNSSYNWDNVYAYIYTNNILPENSPWPGVKMSWDSATGYYFLEAEDYKGVGQIIFNNGLGTQYPAQNNGAYLLQDKSMIFGAGQSWKEYVPDATSSKVYAESDTGLTFTDKAVITLRTQNIDQGTATYQINGETAIPFNDGDKITIGEGVDAGEIVTLKLSGKNGTNTIENTITYKKSIKIYFDKSGYSWNNVYAYVYDKENGNNKMAEWPGTLMTLNSKTNLYEYEVTDSFVSNAYVIFVEKNEGGRYPLKGATDKIETSGKSMILWTDTGEEWLQYYGFGTKNKTSAVSVTCTTDGNIEYYTSTDGTIYTDRTGTLLEDFNHDGTINADDTVIPATGHTYGEPVWSWDSDYTQAQAAFTCTSNDDTQYVNAVVTSKTTAPTCEEDGGIVYTATVTFNGQTYTDTQTVTTNRTGHSYDTPTYTWSEDNSTVTATRTCKNDANHVETETVNTTSAVKTPATCTEKGTTTYTATFTNTAFTTQTKDVQDIAATGHSYGTPEWTWVGDYSQATAKFTCTKCEDVQQVNATINSETTEATYDADGKTVYTATVTFGDNNYTDEKTVVIPKLVATVPSFKTQNLTLSGQIGVNFYLDLSPLTDEEKAASYMEFTVCGRTTKANFDSTKLNCTGQYYGFTCYVTSVEMADTIKAVYHYGDNKTIEMTYSVLAYINKIDEYASNYDGTTLDLIHSIADYGHYAQPFLAAANNWTIGTDHPEMSKHYTNSYEYNSIKASVDSSKFSVESNNSDMDAITYSLSLNSETSINVFLKPKADNAGNVTVTVNGSPATAVKQSDGRYKVTITNISAHKLGDKYKISVTTDKGTAECTVSVLSYVYAVLNSNSFDETAKNAVSSIYKYYDATMKYRNSNNN